MRNAKVFIAAISVLGLSFALNFPAYAAPELNESQLKELLIGRTMVWKLDGRKGTILFRPNGTIYGNSNYQTDNGVYEIKKNGQYCRKWRRWSDGRLSCYAVIKNKDSYIAKLKSGISASSVPFTMKK